MKYCKKCILPDTRPGLVLNSAGICSACVSFEHRNQINWKERKGAFANLVATAKKKVLVMIVLFRLVEERIAPGKSPCVWNMD